MGNEHRVAQRMAECPLRRVTGCGDIDVALGWSDAIPMDTCDNCWRLGGPGTDEARHYREGVANGVLATVAARGLEHVPMVVRLTVLGRHMDRASADAERARLAALPPPPAPTTRWLGLRWYGVPYPKRPAIAAGVGLRCFVSTWRRLKESGCGCLKSAKDLLTGELPVRPAS